MSQGDSGLFPRTDRPRKYTAEQARKPRAGVTHPDGDSSEEFKAECLERLALARKLLDMRTPPEIRTYLAEMAERGEPGVERLREVLNRESRERKRLAAKAEKERRDAIAAARLAKRRR